MMLTFRAGKLAALAVLLSLAAACSREQQDWRSAEAADTVESYGQFLERHPESELVTQARTRVAQLTEEREWQHASSTDTADAYRQFLAQHPNGKWAQEARIRIQNFALNGLPPAGPPMATAPDTTAGAGGTQSGATSGATSASAAAGATAIAAPNELAHAAGAGARAPVEAQASPGELARAAGTQVAATAPASPVKPAPSVSPASPVSPPPPRYSTPYVATPATNITASRSSPSTNASSGYGVQLGAFGSASAANHEWQQLTTRFGAQLGGLTPRVVTANTTTGPLFRLQAQVPDEAHARSLCDVLRKQSQPCVPVLPH